MDLPLAGCRGRPSILEQGIYIRQAVAFVPGAWQYLDAITIRVSPMTPAEAFHPNVLDYEDTEDGAAEPTDDTEYGPARRTQSTRQAQETPETPPPLHQQPPLSPRRPQVQHGQCRPRRPPSPRPGS